MCAAAERRYLRVGNGGTLRPLDELSLLLPLPRPEPLELPDDREPPEDPKLPDDPELPEGLLSPRGKLGPPYEGPLLPRLGNEPPGEEPDPP